MHILVVFATHISHGTVRISLDKQRQIPSELPLGERATAHEVACDRRKKSGLYFANSSIELSGAIECLIFAYVSL